MDVIADEVHAHQAEAKLDASVVACHGHCYEFEHDRDSWEAPRLVLKSEAEARPGYNSMDASEYTDVPHVLHAKVRVLAELVRQAKRIIIYSGAGLSTDAGIDDYASQGAHGDAGSSVYRSPFCAQPTPAHNALVAMYRAGFVYRWINQNHDGLPQKAGLPQQAINEIHGAWHAPDNPVVQMSGTLREDLFDDLLECEHTADLTIALGTSLCGMNADRMVTTIAKRAAENKKLGSVVVGIQRTVLDETATLRIFGRCNRVLSLLAEELALSVVSQPSDSYFLPSVLIGREETDYSFPSIPYDAAGNWSASVTTTLDLREDTELVITGGMHVGALGVVLGFDREGNVRCQFRLKAKRGNLKAPVMMLLGRWWIQAAVDGTVKRIPVVNMPPEDISRNDVDRIHEFMSAYGS